MLFYTSVKFLVWVDGELVVDQMKLVAHFSSDIDEFKSLYVRCLIGTEYLTSRQIYLFWILQKMFNIDTMNI
jgi:hypothetical protein